VRKICADGNIDIESVDWAALEQRRHPGGRVYHGRPLGMLAQIAKGNHMAIWTSPLGLNMRAYALFSSRVNTPPDIIYAPSDLPGAPKNAKPTIIGVPQGTQMGVTFRVLLDSEVKIGSFVQIASGTTVAAYAFAPTQKLRPLTSRDGLYHVIGVRHVGDSRGHGDDWYTEIRGVTWDYFELVLKTVTAY
jgi:hypothetical protein